MHPSRRAARPVLTSPTAGVIASKYTLLDAGTLPVTLTVNGAAVAASDITLQAGADYTLLVWSNAAGPQTSLIVDDNRLPSSTARSPRSGCSTACRRWARR